MGAGPGAALVTDAVNGVSVRRILDRHGPLTGAVALVLLKRTLWGLSEAHLLGLAHGDLRPAKIVVSAAGHSALTGFAVAALTQGDAAFRAPEVWRGGLPSPAADVYAAMCVFLPCLTGQPPSQAKEPFSLMSWHLTAPVSVAVVPEPLRSLLRSGLVKGPERRPGTAELVAEVERTAVAAFGPAWESAGVSELAAVASRLIAEAPRTVPSPAGPSPGGSGSSRPATPATPASQCPARPVVPQHSRRTPAASRRRPPTVAAVALAVVVVAVVVAVLTLVTAVLVRLLAAGSGDPPDLRRPGPAVSADPIQSGPRPGPH
ncbi:hypothetical protein QMK19_24805 [Streptomyces sp. H10-C2]|nr:MULTISPECIES: hypothetical protein [unclassified Streptomyces]MDJ0343030.1 hypothetical protein [Streptomyces sp. PH10-H1]MDJ0372790.1 hypothetical protein [Streptomyces sp. H10-C2]